jgi:hypothetical protein
MSKKFSVPLTSESVTSDQAGGVFRQLFLQCGWSIFWKTRDIGLPSYSNNLSTVRCITNPGGGGEGGGIRETSSHGDLRRRARIDNP